MPQTFMFQINIRRMQQLPLLLVAIGPDHNMKNHSNSNSLVSIIRLLQVNLP